MFCLILLVFAGRRGRRPLLREIKPFTRFCFAKDVNLFTRVIQKATFVGGDVAKRRERNE